MKIILSRKGFDSANGGMPSPILLSDGKILSMPIPSNDNIKYRDLSYGDISYAEMIKDLNPNFPYENCHLDPDIREQAIKREGIWKAGFGQEGPAATHLDNQKVDIDDIFLFFGWFRKVTLDEHKKKYVFADAQDLHVIYGYLQVGEILDTPEKMRKSLPFHPHSQGVHPINNRIYVAKDKLFGENYPGAGVFPFNEELVLTKGRFPRSRWKETIFPEGKYNITFHGKKNYSKDYFQSAPIGQEFVITSADLDLKKNSLSKTTEENIKKWIIGRINNDV